MKPNLELLWTSGLLVICAQCVFCSSHGMISSNIDFAHTIVYEAVNKTEYFGFTVALLKEKNASWILVGAPKATTNSNFKHDDATPGKVYACRFKGGCENIHVQEANYEVQITKTAIEKNDHAMLGSTLDVYGDVILVCAPKSFILPENTPRMFGACFASNSGVHGKYKKLTGLRGAPNAFLPSKRDVPFYVYGQSGFSGIITNTNGLLLGAPGIYLCSGGTMEYDNDFISPIVTTQLNNAFNQLHANAFMGYAVTSGQYFKADATYYHAASAPRGADYSQVIIFKQGNFSSKKMTSIKTIETRDLFGHSLASGDYNGDGSDEILIGAPLCCSPTTKDRGQAYIYKSKTDAKGMELWATLPATDVRLDEGARFGTAVASLLDFNMDKFGVAAPFASGGGAVYIYKGGEEKPELIKKITGDQFHPSIQGFGYSFSRPVDIDDNNVTDFAIGAYKSGHIVLFRARPLADIDLKLNSSINGNLMRNTSNLQVSLLASLNSDTKVESAEVTLTMKVSPSSWNLNENDGLYLKKINISRASNTILDFNFSRQLDDSVNGTKPMIVEVKVVVPDEEISHLVIDSEGNHNNTDKFSKFKPTFRKQVYIKRLEQRYVPDCKSICNPQYKLDLVVGTPGEEKFYSKDRTAIPVMVSVARLGEDLVHTKLRLFVRLDGVKIKHSGPCKEDGVDFLCIIGVAQNRTYNFSLEVNEEKMKDEKAAINVTALVQPESGNVTAVSKSVTLFSNASVSLAGYPEDSVYKYTNESIVINYKFSVEKYGQSPLREVRVKFDIPVKYEKKEFAILLNTHAKSKGSSHTIDCQRGTRNYDDYQSDLQNNVNASAILVNRTLEISCAGKNWECITLDCAIGTFLKNSKAVELGLQISFTPPKIAKKKDRILLGVHAMIDIIKPANPEPALKDLTVKLVAFANVDQRVVETIADVSWWILIAAVVCAIFSLIVLTTILQKCGFFKREKKAELNVLKRQTASIMPIFAEQRVTMSPGEETT